MKFVTADIAFTPAGLKDDTPYTVMFGPDKCGSTNKVRGAHKEDRCLLHGAARCTNRASGRHARALLRTQVHASVTALLWAI